MSDFFIYKQKVILLSLLRSITSIEFSEIMLQRGLLNQMEVLFLFLRCVSDHSK
jgi:hypothetical protein